MIVNWTIQKYQLTGGTFKKVQHLHTLKKYLQFICLTKTFQSIIIISSYKSVKSGMTYFLEESFLKMDKSFKSGNSYTISKSPIPYEKVLNVTHQLSVKTTVRWNIYHR